MTKLFDCIEQMRQACDSVPELTGRVYRERVLPLDITALPAVCILPRRVQQTALAGEMQGREATVLVIVRTAGDEPGEAAHALLNAAHEALTTWGALNDGSVQIELSTETFRYIDNEQTMCDLQAEYLVEYDHERGSLL
jgi:hypothetical protein